MALDDGHAEAAGDGPALSRAIDFMRIRGMDPASERILRQEIREAGAAQDRVVPFFLHLPGEASRAAFQDGLTQAGYGRITTEIADAPPFYYAEDYHQQYLHKNPDGYCGLGGTGVSCPIGVKL